MDIFRDWLDRSNHHERKKFYRLLGMSRVSVHQIAQKFRNRVPTVETAARICEVANQVRREGDDYAKVRLPIMDRGQVCTVCAECPYYKVAKDFVND